MHKYGGTLIHRSRDEFGTIEVVEDCLQRSLHFGTEPKQSSMNLKDPVVLALSYTRAMTAVLLFTHEPRRVLLLGLGGGSLAKFLLHHYPNCRVEAVEHRQEVATLARRFFHLPEDPRLTIHIDDAGSYVRNRSEPRYDLILVDAFVDSGIASSVCGSTFFHACARSLKEGGALSMNLWSGDLISAEELLEDLRESFARVLRLPVEGKDNVIALALTQALTPRHLGRYKERAKALEQALGVEYPAFLRTLRKANGWLKG